MFVVSTQSYTFNNIISIRMIDHPCILRQSVETDSSLILSLSLSIEAKPHTHSFSIDSCL